MARSQGSVRMGPISIFTLVIVLCLSVMAVLSYTTAHAASAVAQREAVFTSDTYMNEIAGQEFECNVDTVLASVRSTHPEQIGLQSEAIRQLDLNRDSLAPSGEVFLNDSQVQAVFVSDNGRRLIVTLRIDDSAHYHVVEWTFATQEAQAPEGQTLWMP